MQIVTTCEVCGKKYSKYIDGYYNRRASKDICYDCALQSLTKGQPPEEGDFNTAQINSGEMSEEERKWLSEDLRSVDRAACERDPNDDPWFVEDDQDQE